MKNKEGMGIEGRLAAGVSIMGQARRKENTSFSTFALGCASRKPYSEVLSNYATIIHSFNLRDCSSYFPFTKEEHSLDLVRIKPHFEVERKAWSLPPLGTEEFRNEPFHPAHAHPHITVGSLP